MSVVTELLAKPGVLAAGTYTYKAEAADHRGALSEELAAKVAVMCHATTKNVLMEGDMLSKLSPRNGIQPARGWLVRGPRYTVCVVANVFCFVEHDRGSLNQILGFMRTALADETVATLDLV